jgi:16S rRNA C967 or C1407 C5-methylase (RsmB/RsmF family)
MESDFILLDNFDYAIVDAECTHDASYRHLSHINIVPHNDHGDELVEEDYRLPLSSDGRSVKPDVRLCISDSSSNSKSHRMMNESNNLRALQRDLVHNGFRLLRPGGVLVYSTCSKDELQNEEVIKWLQLTEGRRVQVVPIIDDIRQYISKAIACSVVETSNISPDEVGMELLQQELPDLISSLKTLGTAGIRELSDNICRDVASQDSPILMESTVLRGTMHISYKSGMSGLFIAKIRKAVDD